MQKIRQKPANGVVALGVLALCLGGGWSARAQAGDHLSWGPDLVVNGSFEDGFTGWSITLAARQ